MATALVQQDLAVIEKADALARRARLAAAVFSQYSQKQVDCIIKAMTMAAIDAAHKLAIAAHQETKMGLVEDKTLKNLVASEFQYHQIRHQKTVGIIKEYPQENMVEVAEPIGVILALAPVTNPTSTVIFKSIACAKTRNSVIFSPHLMAANSSNLAANILYEAALAAGAPHDFITWVDKSPNLRQVTECLMVHQQVDLIFATGGTQMVKAAYSSGKPALGVGSGNTPVYVHRSAAIPGAAMDITISKTFDYGTECPSEQTLIIDAPVAEQLLTEFKRLGAYICTPEETEKVADIVIDARTGGMNYKFVGQPAKVIADRAGVSVPADCKMLLCPLVGELRQHKMVVEKLMPVLGYVITDNVEDGINQALDVNYAGGTGHTAGIFADDEEVIEKFGNAINAGRIIVNSPTSIGGLGGVYNNLPTTLVFGCGTGGGNITTDNVGVKNLLNYKRMPRRSNFTMSFHTTKDIYINPGSIDHLRNLKTQTAFVITSKSASRRGHLALVRERLPAQTHVEVFNDIGTEPDFATITRAIDMMHQSKPDTIIALGGGSVLDAAKIIRLFYEYPDLKLPEISVNFLDFRHRLSVFPEKTNVQLVAIPTTSGTGSEVTPFAVISVEEPVATATPSTGLILGGGASRPSRNHPSDQSHQLYVSRATHAKQIMPKDDNGKPRANGNGDGNGINDENGSDHESINALGQRSDIELKSPSGPQTGRTTVKRKLSLIDECLLPDVAIIDANLTVSLPREITVDTAFDAFTHALESLISCYASDYTDGLALEAMRLIFEALPPLLTNPSNILWRHKLHNAACLAGMAIGNASVGVNHALAHSLGAIFDIPHGRANSVFLLSTITYNSTLPLKFTVASTYPLWVADEKYARAAQFLNLPIERASDSRTPLTENVSSNTNSREGRKRELILALKRAIFDLLETCSQPKSIAELGISEKAFRHSLPELTSLAFNDLSLRTNPSMLLQEEVVRLFLESYPPRVRQ